MAESIAFLRRHRLALAYLVVLVATAVLSATGLTLWIPVTVAAAPWFAVIARHVGALLAGVATLLGLAFATLGGLIATHLLGFGIAPTAAVSSVLVGVGGLVLLVRLGPPTIVRAQWLPGLASLLGGAIWIGAVYLAAWIPGASHYSWVMNGDSANNVLFVRDIFTADGIAIGPRENPVPLPAGLLAIGMAAGRAATPSSGMMAHDIAGFVQVWSLAIAVLCTLAGLIAAASVPASRPIVRTIAAAGGSLLPLTWYIVGYPIEYGFMNTQVALAIVLCAWLVYLRSDRRPAFAIGLLSVASTLLLAAWGPLVLMPGALMVAIVIRHFRALLKTRGLDAVVALVGLVQLLVFGLVSTIPVLFVQGEFLAAAGGAFPFSRVLFFGLAALLIVLGFVGAGALGPDVRAGAIALALAALAGAGVLLFTARAAPNPWMSYYPLKFLWLGGVVMFIVILGLVTGLAASWFRGRVATVMALVVVAVGTIVGVGVAQHTTTGYVQRNPVVRLFAGDFWGNGDTEALRVFDYSDLERPTILWRSGDPYEGALNFWVMQVQSGTMSGRLELKYAAYGDYDVDDISDLCRIVPLMEAPVDVLTADSGLADEVARECPEIDVRILPFADQG